MLPPTRNTTLNNFTLYFWCFWLPRFRSDLRSSKQQSCKRRCARCLLKLRSRLRQTQHRIQKIDTSNDMLYFILLNKPCSRLRETLLWITLHCLFDVSDYPDFVRHVSVIPKTKAVNVAVRAVCLEIALTSVFQPSFRIVLADVWLDSRSGWNRFHSIRSQNHEIELPGPFWPVPGVSGSGELGFDPGRGHYSSLV